MGPLYPVMVQDTLPGDKFTITPEMLIRFAPMTFPIMHRIDAYIHFFYVPNRILWENWQYFLAGEDFVPPYFEGKTGMGEPGFQVDTGSIWDYLGLPTTTNLTEKVLAFPYLAYARVFNEYFQDQNNDSTYTTTRDKLKQLSKMNGYIAPSDFNALATNYSDLILEKRAFEHDYFTSALPWAQKGDAVNIPLTLGEISVSTARLVSDESPAFTGTTNIGLSGGETVLRDSNNDPIELYTDTADTELTGTINQLRTAMQLQKFLELNARSGTRYNELIRAHFNEDIGDARINRPEFIGSIKNNVVISEVLQTSQTSEDAALGDYAGHATGVVSGNTMSFRCPEHGWIIGVLSIIPRTSYFQGIPRKFQKLGYLDYFWKEFAHIGEQAILSKELYYDNSDDTGNNSTFGYIPRYSEYKYNPSEIHADFKSTFFDFTLARKFDARPTLSSEFIYVQPENQKHVFAVTQEDVNSLYAHIFFNVKAARKIPFFTNPGGL